MRIIQISLFIFAISISAISCKKGVSSEAPSADTTATRVEVQADAVSAQGMVHSSAAVEGKSGSAHRFIRTAEVKFKTQNVVKATYAIEDMTNKMGGYVAYTNLNSNIDDSETKKISPDSSVIISHYTISNDMLVISNIEHI